MIHGVYAIYDTKAECYFPPFIHKTQALALRMFEEMANDANNVVGRYPTDYCLFRLGDWDDVDGSYELRQAPTSLGLAMEYVQQEDPGPLFVNGAEQGSRIAPASGESPVNGQLEDGGV